MFSGGIEGNHFLWNCSHLPKKCLTKNFIFSAVSEIRRFCKVYWLEDFWKYLIFYYQQQPPRGVLFPKNTSGWLLRYYRDFNFGEVFRLGLAQNLHCNLNFETTAEYHIIRNSPKMGYLIVLVDIASTCKHMQIRIKLNHFQSN